MDAKITTIISNILIWFLSTVESPFLKTVHSSLWYGFSPVWMQRWPPLSQTYWYGFSPLWNPLSWKLFIAHFDMVSLQYGCKDDYHYLKHIDMVSLHCGIPFPENCSKLTLIWFLSSMDAKMTTIISNILIWFLSTVESPFLKTVHSSLWYGFSPVWMQRWPPISQTYWYGFSPLWNPLSWKLFIAHFDMVSLQYGCKDDHHYLKHIDMVSLHCGTPFPENCS